MNNTNNKKVSKKSIKLNGKGSVNDVFRSNGAEGIDEIIRNNDTNIQDIDDYIHVKDTSVNKVKEGFFTMNDKGLLYSVIGCVDIGGKNTLTMSVQVTNFNNRGAFNAQVDLFNTVKVKEFAESASDYVCVDPCHIANALQEFMSYILLDDMAKTIESTVSELPKTATISPKEKELAMDVLRDSSLMDKISCLLGTAGVVREEGKRLFLWLIALSYKLKKPLHAMVQGSSGSGKSHLINTIAECFPPEDTISVTRITSKSLYHYGKGDLVGKLLLIQDFDGLDDEAMFAMREMQSAGSISTSTTEKDKKGNLHSTVKVVKVQFATLGATTKPELYLDNMSRSAIVGVDESIEQTQAIIDYSNAKRAGQINLDEVCEVKKLLQNMVRLIESKSVINPFATCIKLPVEAKMLRRLNEQYQTFIEVVTLLHQHQRCIKEDGAIVTTPADIYNATRLFFDAIMLKVDELDSSTRQFYEELKEMVKRTNKRKFNLPLVRKELNLGKTQVFKYMATLRQLDYVKREGTANKGHIYWISEWDEMTHTRYRIKECLFNQIEDIERTENERKKNARDTEKPKKTA